MSCYCDYEPANLYSAAVYKARKKHRCSECGAIIKPGERYERVFGVWDGEANTYRTCSLCLDLRNFVRAHVPCFCWAHGRTIEDAVATAYEYDDTPGLVFGALRRRVTIERHRIGELK